MIYYWEKTPNFIKQSLVTLFQKSARIDSKSKKQYLIVGSGFDIETTTINDRNFISAYCYHWQMSFNNLTVGGRTLLSMYNFYQYLLSIIPDGFRLLVTDANLGFEFSFCRNYWNKLGITEIFAKKKRNPLKVVIANKIEIREVLGLFGRNLESIADNFSSVKKLKGDLDYTLMRFSNTPLTETEKQYCENDVQILSQLGYYIFQNYFGRNMDLPLTAISELRQMVKQRMGKRKNFIMKEIQDNMPDSDIYWKLRNYLFKGGLCGTNSLYMDRILENVFCADITSDYPAAMNHYLYPMGKLYQIDSSDFLQNSKPQIACIEFFKLQSKSSHSILSTHKALDFDRKKVELSQPNGKPYYIIDNGRVWYADKITYIVNDIEFRSIIQAYKYDYCVVHWALEFERYGRLPSYLLDVLNEQYLKKQKLKQMGLDETIDYMFAKNKVNGMFGMTCTALYCDEFVVDEYTGEIEPRKVDGEVYKKEYAEAIKSVFLSPFWGMWITSYARSILIDAITKFPHCIIQYDTDSLYFYANHPESNKLREYLDNYNKHIIELNKAIFNDKHFEDLGTWDIDKKPIKYFKGLGSKRYMCYKYDKKKDKYVIKSTVAGCPKGAILEQYESEHGKVVTSQQIRKVFEYFHDNMVIDEKHSKKLRPVYIDDYKGMKFVKCKVQDYLGNEEEIILTSGTALLPNTFTLGLSDAHTRFYLTVQGEYNNAPKGICKIYEDILTDVDIIEIFE